MFNKRLSLRSVHSLARRCVSLAAAISCAVTVLSATTAPALAQLDIVSRDLYTERTRNEGNRIAFCLRPFGPIAKFEAELAERIGKILLTEVRMHVLNERSFPVRPSIYDFYFGLTDDQMYITMAEHCDVVLGMHLSPASASWLRLSRPYVVSDIVGVTKDPKLTTLDDLGPDIRIGVQGLAAGDASLVSYFKTKPEGTVPQRVAYRSNQDLFNALNRGEVDAALIWEGALMAGTEGATEGYYPMAQLPFPVDKVLVSAAVRVEDTILGAMIDEAIGALEANGSLREMGYRHGVLWERGQ